MALQDKIQPPDYPIPGLSDEDVQKEESALMKQSTPAPSSSLGQQVGPWEQIPGSELHNAGKMAYAQLMPKITAQPGSTDYFRQRQEQLEFEKAHPWGAPISKHPGTFGTILHGIAKAGNIAGEVLAPGTLENIPGTDLNRERNEREDLAGIQKAEQEQNQETEANASETRANAEKENADTAASVKTEKPEDINQQYADAVGDAVKRGVNPLEDPTVQKYADAIQNVQKQPQQKPTAAHITYDQGIPVSVTGKDGNTYDVNDPKLPAELKPLVQSATRAHGQAVTEAEQKQARAFGEQEKMFNERQNAPTNTTKAMYDAAPHVEEFIQRINPLIDKLEKSGDLGPGAGRWNEFWAGKVGSGNPDFVRLRTDVGLLSTLLMRMHVGARGGEYIMQHFSDMINSGKQDPASMRAALGEIEAYAKQLMADRQGGGNATGENKSAAPATNDKDPLGILSR
jgi:hypothetical protein